MLGAAEREDGRWARPALPNPLPLLVLLYFEGTPSSSGNALFSCASHGRCWFGADPPRLCLGVDGVVVWARGLPTGLKGREDEEGFFFPPLLSSHLVTPLALCTNPAPFCLNVLLFMRAIRLLGRALWLGLLKAEGCRDGRGHLATLRCVAAIFSFSTLARLGRSAATTRGVRSP